MSKKIRNSHVFFTLAAKRGIFLGGGFAWQKMIKKSCNTGLADLNHVDLNHWFKSWNNSIDFLNKNQWFKSKFVNF